MNSWAVPTLLELLTPPTTARCAHTIEDIITLLDRSYTSQIDDQQWLKSSAQSGIEQLVIDRMDRDDVKVDSLEHRYVVDRSKVTEFY